MSICESYFVPVPYFNDGLEKMSNMNKIDPLKICYVSYREKLETNLEHLSRYVVTYGYDVTIINISNHPKNNYYTTDGRRIVYIDLPDRLKTRKSQLIFILKTVKFLKKQNFSIIHIESSCKYFWLLKLSFKKAKFVYHLLSYPLSKNRLPVLKRLITVLLQSIWMDSIIIQSEEQKEKWIGIRHFKKTKIIPVGFDSQLLYPLDNAQKTVMKKRLGFEQNMPVLIYAGAMGELRQLNRLIFALKEVHKVYQQVKLMMVGNNDSAISIKSTILSLNLQNSIIFTGEVPHKEMVKYYGVADVGISFIPINKNFTCNPPLKTYEYLACALPCIATRTISNSKIIKDQFNGILVNDTVEDVARAIIELLNNDQKQKTLKQNARKSIALYDFETITKTSLVPLYADLLK
ncbi:MAG: glycosyltransferase family 4 protein [Candidatus Aenigmarchaeota archaeon]|nr:glycosyltransferase family 4 protein [Candidatus Aenigmarchaeota archaeon]